MILGYYKGNPDEKARHEAYINQMQEKVKLSVVARGTDARHHWAIYRWTLNLAGAKTGRSESKEHDAVSSGMMTKGWKDIHGWHRFHCDDALRGRVTQWHEAPKSCDVFRGAMSRKVAMSAKVLKPFKKDFRPLVGIKEKLTERMGP